MVEQLKKEDILIPIKLYIFSNKEYIEVSRIKEIVKDIIAFSVTTNSRVELQCKIINRFGVLFDNNLKDVPEANDQTSIDDSGVVGKTGKPPQSPKSRVCDLADNRTPSQEIRHEFQSAENPVGVSSFCQKCGHEKEKHHFFENGKPLKKCMGVFNISFCDCSGFVEKTK